ncbi:GP99 [Caviid betaherpesvirus 2]|uniref:Cytoplasmic envelopment protein 3 n=1 Tax=Guinea pig cytomegalovirus (strain 22122) TaxID=103920 RepID=B7TQ01_GPCMV|nr:GP99 [Caviid betaherpesvirus 2]AGE11569.1 GP99 [Caviid betaherpesvirus 2]AIL83957.1 GP99 [BAC cloning vector GPN13BACdenovo_preserved(MM)]BAJ78557.1 GP99 [Caviid betaherpesvirus 2]
MGSGFCKAFCCDRSGKGSKPLYDYCGNEIDLSRRDFSPLSDTSDDDDDENENENENDMTFIDNDDDGDDLGIASDERATFVGENVARAGSGSSGTGRKKKKSGKGGLDTVPVIDMRPRSDAMPKTIPVPVQMSASNGTGARRKTGVSGGASPKPSSTNRSRRPSSGQARLITL